MAKSKKKTSGRVERKPASTGAGVRFARETMNRSVPFRLTETQYQAVKARAAELEISIGDVVRLALDAYFALKR